MSTSNLDKSKQVKPQDQSKTFKDGIPQIEGYMGQIKSLNHSHNQENFFLSLGKFSFYSKLMSLDPCLSFRSKF